MVTFDIAPISISIRPDWNDLVNLGAGLSEESVLI